MSYLGFTDKINQKFENVFSEISSVYNFDNGVEFELAICDVLKVLLPSKYGVTRGHIVTQDGDEVGDDIIIYDSEHFPTLRLLNEETIGRKQHIPVEAVYAYIEAKHTLFLSDDSNNSQSLQKALEQVAKVKNLPRKDVPLSQINKHIKLGGASRENENWPDTFNPMYTAIFGRFFKIDPDNYVPKGAEALINLLLNKFADSKPDLLIGGADFIALPAVGTEINSPFFIPGKSTLYSFHTKDKSFGIGITNLLFAIENIKLGEIYWPQILADELNLKINNPQ